MRSNPKLTLKSISKRHKSNPKDKDLHTVIENKGIKTDTFNKLIKKGAKEKPFDKK